MPRMEKEEVAVRLPERRVLRPLIIIRFLFPPWRQPSGKYVVSLVNPHTTATSKRWHLWEIDLSCLQLDSRVDYTHMQC